MIATATLAAAAVAAVCCALLPPAALAWLRRRAGGLRWRAVAAGALGFVLASQVLGKGLHLLVLGDPQGMAAWIERAPWTFAIYAALVAGVFEESGRYVGLRLAARRGEDALAVACFAVGWAGMEAWLVGALPQAQLVVFGHALNAGTLADALGGRVPPEALASIEASLRQAGPVTAAVATYERGCAFVMQLGFTLLMARRLAGGPLPPETHAAAPATATAPAPAPATARPRPALAVVAALAALHALVDLPAAMFQARLLPLAAAEACFGVVAAGFAAWMIRAGALPPRAAAPRA